MTKTRMLLIACTIVSLLVLAGCSSEAPKPAEQAAAPAQQAQPVDPATAATITGKVDFQGTAPAAARLRMDADAACAKMHSQPATSQEVVVNPNNTLRWVFVYVKDGLGNRVFPAPKEPVKLDQMGCMYDPHVVGVMTDQELHIHNSDQTTHNIHPVPTVNREWNKSMAPSSEQLVETFAREEIMIPVKCNIHPWMRSYVGVVRNPFYAVTGEDGSFKLSGLPPGDYTIAAWQEKYGTQEQKVTVGPKESKDITFTFSPAGAGD